MNDNNNKNNNNYYFPIFVGIGLVLGILFDQLALGLCFGIAIGLALDNKKELLELPLIFLFSIIFTY